MSTMTDPLAVLLGHDRWATGQILDACEALTTEQMHQRFEIGLGSLHNTIIHDAAAVRQWGEVLARAEITPWPDNAARSMGELRRMAESAFEVFAKAAVGDPGETYVREREGKRYVFTRVAIVTHVHTHGVHHRAQCINMLRHLGVKPLPQSSVLEWMRSQQAQ